MIDVRIYFAIYNALICKEADTRMNVIVYAVDDSMNSIGPTTEPCGTPDVTLCDVRQGSTETRCLRFNRKDVIQLCVLPVIPYEVSLDGRRLCWTLFIYLFIKYI